MNEGRIVLDAPMSLAGQDPRQVPATRPAPPKAPCRARHLAVWLSIALFAYAVLNAAWLCDDAYITLRTVDNWLQGHGLVWNVGERVQAFTHPLWLLLLAWFQAWIEDPYVTAMVASLLCIGVFAGLFVRMTAQSHAAVIVGLTALALSKAVADFATSGLETPLTFLLTAALFGAWRLDQPSLLWCTIGLAALNRLDTLLVFGPIAAARLYERRREWRLALLAFSPLAAWELFSVFYYGSLVPNTAYAKLDTGLAAADLLPQGLHYVADSLHRDPVTLALIAGATSAAVALQRDRQALGAALGIAVYLLYVLWIGGDFMSGRLFAFPAVVATCLLVCAWPAAMTVGRSAAAAALLVAVSAATAAPPIAAPGRCHAGPAANGIVDERAFFYEFTGLLRNDRSKSVEDHAWVVDGKHMAANGPPITSQQAVGLFGYYAGPDVYVMDRLALTDPLLARLPIADATHWRIGHFERAVPQGYWDTLVSGQVRLEDLRLGAFYHLLSQVTRGSLWDPPRWLAALQLALGPQDPGLRAYRAAHLPRR